MMFEGLVARTSPSLIPVHDEHTVIQHIADGIEWYREPPLQLRYSIYKKRRCSMVLGRATPSNRQQCKEETTDA
jgi:hypothetical protein